MRVCTLGSAPPDALRGYLVRDALVFGRSMPVQESGARCGICLGGLSGDSRVEGRGPRPSRRRSRSRRHPLP